MTDWIFFGPSRLIAWAPFAGFVLAAVLIGWQVVKSLAARETFSRQWFRHAPVFAGLLWLIFTFYEWQIQAATAGAAKLASTSNLFRVDLIVLTPLLYVLTCFAVWTLIRGAVPKREVNEAGPDDIEGGPKEANMEDANAEKARGE